MKNIRNLVNGTSVSLILATAVLSVLYRLFPQVGFLIGAIACGTACYHTVSRGLIGPLVTRFRERLNPDGFWFRQHRFEPHLYKALRVRRWKNKLPSYDPAAFSLQDADPKTIIQNSCNAELIHEICIVTGFLPLVMVPFVGAFWVFFLTSVATALADSLFVILLRYNRPRLVRILKRKAAS